MSIELKQVVEQSLDLSTPTLREMVTRHAAVIDSRATLEDMPEALAFQIDMARALLREFTAIQQAQQPAKGEPVLFIHPDTFAMNNAHVGAWKPGHELTGYIPLYTHPAPSVPDDVARDAERLNDLEALVKSKGTHGLSFDYCRHVEDGYVVEKGFRLIWRHTLCERKPTLREAIDAAMLAAKEGTNGEIN